MCSSSVQEKTNTSSMYATTPGKSRITCIIMRDVEAGIGESQRFVASHQHKLQPNQHNLWYCINYPWQVGSNVQCRPARSISFHFKSKKGIGICHTQIKFFSVLHSSEQRGFRVEVDEGPRTTDWFLLLSLWSATICSLVFRGHAHQYSGENLQANRTLF